MTTRARAGVGPTLCMAMTARAGGANPIYDYEYEGQGRSWADPRYDYEGQGMGWANPMYDY